MEYREAREVIACLPKDRTLFHYFKDQYALFLLEKAIGEGARVGELKSSRYAKLLQKPIVKELAANAPNGVLDAAVLGNVWPQPSEAYLLTLGLWGNRRYWRGYQISRPGVNLVLQLNFSMKHKRMYCELDSAGGYRLFGVRSHPVARKGYLTLAWARIDLDLDTGEALIEEVQTDWLRRVKSFERALRRRKTPRGKRAFVDHWMGEDVKLHQVERYLKAILAAYETTWDEAMLTAAVWFLSEEIGIRKIYYHSFETGRKLKGIEADWAPPRSLYTKLPRRFCFEATEEAPSFIAECKCRRTRSVLKENDATWFQLEL